MKDNKQIKESSFHVVKRAGTPLWQTIVIKLTAVLIGLIAGAIFCSLIAQKNGNPINFFAYLWKGVFGSPTSMGSFVQKLALLVLVSLALLPAFKMKFWNLGGNGQILIGALVTTIFMKFMGGKAPDAVVITLMVLGGVMVAYGAVSLFNTYVASITGLYIAFIILFLAVLFWYGYEVSRAMKKYF